MPDIYEFLDDIFSRKSVNVIEIGAHIGTDTERLLEYVKSGKMYSFEPDPRNIGILRERLKDKNIEIVQCAVGGKNGTAEFNLSSGKPPYEDEMLNTTEQHTASSSLKKPKAHLERFPWCKFEDKVQVDVVTLDSFFKDRLKPDEIIDIIWADVQGAEIDMINGGKNILERTRYLFTEFYNNELYEGQVNLDTLIASLPGKWNACLVLGDEVLLQNNKYSTEYQWHGMAHCYWDHRNKKFALDNSNQNQLMSEDIIEQIKAYDKANEIFKKATSILEIGCGTGELIHNISQEYDNIKELVGVDFSMNALRFAMTHYSSDRLYFRLKNVRGGLDFGYKFNISICSNFLEHFVNPYLIIDEMRKVSDYVVFVAPYNSPVTDGYEEEGGAGHVFMVNEEVLKKYTFESHVFKSRAWHHSGKGEEPRQIIVMIKGLQNG